MTTLGISRLRILRPSPRVAAIGVALAVVVAGTYIARSLSTPTPGATRPSAIAAAGAAEAPGSGGDGGKAIGAPGVTVDSGAIGGAPAGLSQLDHSIGIWTANVRRDPKDFLAATNLAVLYNARGRLTANVDDYARALEAAKTGVAAAPDYAPARLAETTVLLAMHDFGAALRLATEIFREDPNQLGALAAIGDAQQELGDYQAARATFGRLATHASGAAVDARMARFAYLTGDPARGLAAATRARDEGAGAAAAGDDAASAVFYHFQLGEMARLTGDPMLAEREYEAALGVRPTDLGSLVGLARVEAFDGRRAAAILTLRKATAIAPQPDAVALLGDLLASGGDNAAANRQYATVRQIRRLSELAGTVYDRQLLLFELDHRGASEDVLARAQTALAARHDAYGHDVVAWALYRLGRIDDAAREATAAQASGIVDARILFHTGAIGIARGDSTGVALVRHALALGPALDPVERAEAESLVR